MTMQFEAPVSEWHVGLMSATQVIDLDLFRDIAVRLPSDGAHQARDIARSSARVVLGHVAGFAGSGMRLVARKQRWGHDVLISEFIDCDTLAYLSLEKLSMAVRDTGAEHHFCYACYTGKYPTELVNIEELMSARPNRC